MPDHEEQLRLSDIPHEPEAAAVTTVTYVAAGSDVYLPSAAVNQKQFDGLFILDAFKINVFIENLLYERVGASCTSHEVGTCVVQEQ